MSDSSKRYCKLILVSENNNNKYYEMREEGDSVVCKYGRINSPALDMKQYPISRWNSIYKSKIRKGYKDVTDIVTEVVEENSSASFVDLKDRLASSFLEKMYRYTKKLVSSTYSVKSENVTQKQLDEAQKIIDFISELDESQDTLINKSLISLYTVIPRFMNNVRLHLMPYIKFNQVIEFEQQNLNALASQVSIKSQGEKQIEQKSFLDLLGLKTIISIEADKYEYLGYIFSQLNSKKILGVFEFEKPEEEQKLSRWLSTQKNKDTKWLIHGTRCSSVVPIIQQGLKIRPTGNYQFSGKVYGDGNYFSETVSKSLNYTGSDEDRVLLIYEVHTGNPFVYNGWYNGNDFKLCYEELQKRGFDSTYVRAGNGLLNSEIIAYKEEQSKLKFAIWLSK